MNKTEKKNVRISKALIFMIIGLLALALGFKMYNPQSSERAELFPEGLEDQISLELRDDRTQVSDEIGLTGSEAAEELEKIYLIRVNHDDDIAVNLAVNILSFTGDIDNALQIRVYDDTNEQLIYDGGLKELAATGYEQLNEKNGAGKTDTRYSISLYLPEGTGTQYDNSEVQIELAWSVPQSQHDNLGKTKSGDVRVILYAFLAMAALVGIVFILMRKHINPAVYSPVKPDSDDEKEPSNIE